MRSVWTEDETDLLKVQQRPSPQMLQAIPPEMNSYVRANWTNCLLETLIDDSNSYLIIVHGTISFNSR